ncbi:Putative 115 kDa protein in type-1 retrotransposable element R1DM-like Protein [Tribolium castaneum]|uniref:115 kDa protein in type-1 retrotransposable element R1DM-like Protein n=1 Tax=Tribolium castaneum TaxID=7070 RepID=D7ELI3_TRICA|nr:Putative 115 kDa protein in type-1 retrotransposable element R1DM-like Protein [Tribolium castaneum]
MTKAKQTFKEKVEKRRRQSWLEFAENDLARNPWGVIYKLASEKFKTRGILQSFQTDDENITRDFRSTMEFLVANLLPDDDPDINTEEQRITQGDYRATTAEVGSDVVITEAEVDQLVSQIQNKKAPGLDNLKGKILKRLHPKITPIITRIYNACWTLNYFPTTWKKGNLVILLKDPKASHSNIKNYRPITLLPEHGKILEKTIRRKLEEELSPLHSQRQFGFVKGRSTSDALHLLVSTIRDSEAKYVATIFFDIKGAFDNLWWPSLIKTLRNRGVTSKLTAMIKSYLTDRVVEFTQGDVSVRKFCTKGCPQGSVLGPTLWNLTMDTLLNSEWSDFATPIAYADDLAVIVKSDLRSQLKTRLNQVTNKITDWATRNKLTVSETKTTFMIHKCPPRAHHRDLDIRIYGKKISLVKTQKYLGILLDSKLHFESHASYTAKKVRQISMSLRTLASRKFGQTCDESLRVIYHGAIVPIITYGSRIWSDRLHVVKNNRQYLSAQAPFNRILAKCYASVSKEAAAVLAGNLPIDIEIQVRNCISEIKHGRSALLFDEVITPQTFDSVAHCKEYARLRALDCWQSRWETSTKGRVSFEFFPDVFHRLEGPPITFSHHKSQVLTGHGNFGIHQTRLGKSENAKCDNCPEYDDDPIHRILECPMFTDAQNRIREITGIWPPDLTQVPYIDDDEVFSALSLDLTPPDLTLE